MVTAILQRQDGTIYGTKNVPEDCKAIKWGGSIFVALDPTMKHANTMTYIRTDVFVFNDLLTTPTPQGGEGE